MISTTDAANDSFKDSFWVETFLSSTGIDTLIKRAKDGSKTYKEVEDFLKQRARIEDDYSKALNKLSRHPMGSLEIGTLAASLQTIKDSLAKISEEHAALVCQLNEQASRVHSQTDMHTTTRKTADDNVKKQANQKKDLHSKMTNSQQNYMKKSVAHDQAKNAFDSERSAAQQKDKRELDKLEQKKMKCEQEKMKANDIYKDLVNQLERTRVSWENEMVTACDNIQKAEEERIEFLTKELWIYLNSDSTTCVERDERNEDSRKVLEKCDVKKDIQEFIQNSRTGPTRPKPIPYKSYDIKSGTLITPTIPAIPNSPRPPPPSLPFHVTHQDNSVEDEAGYSCVTYN